MEAQKKCTKCKNILNLSLFRKDSRLKSGIGCTCKSCSSKQAAEWKSKNQERAKLNQKQWAEKNKKELSAKKMAWAKNNPERKIASDKRYAEKHKEKRLAYSKEYRKKNLEAIKQRNLLWRKANLSYVLSKNRERYANKRNRIPKWITDEELLEIKKLYQRCKELNDNGGDFHVDHIIPFKGETVSGFHVLANLRIIPAKENLSKKNRFSGDWD